MKKPISLLLFVLLIGCSETRITVSFDPNGAPDSAAFSQTLAQGEFLTFPQNSFTYGGFTFSGWSLSGNGKIIYQPGESYCPTGDTCFLAVWTPVKTVTVSFNANGGSGRMDSVCGFENTEIRLPECTFTNGTRSFLGWAVSSSGIKIYDDESVISIASSDLTLYALWSDPEKVYFAVTFYPENGASQTVTQQIESGVKTALRRNSFSYSNFEFKGWALSSGSSVISYKDGASVTLSAPLNLYAVWEKIAATETVYTVSFNANGGSGSAIPSQTVKKGASLSLPKNTFTKNGALFIGWATSASGQALYTDMQTITVNSNFTLYAVWEEEQTAPPAAAKGTVTFHPGADDATGSMEPLTGLTDGETVTLPKAAFSRSGYCFVGWSLSPDSSNPDFQDMSPLYSYYPGTAHLYAVWEPEASAVLISFDPNGGSGSMDSFYVKSGWTLTIPPNDFTPPEEGYSCNAYDTVPAPNGYSHYRIGGTAGFTESCTLYAYWAPDSGAVGGASETYKGQTVFVEGVTIREEDWVQGDRGNLGKYVEWKSGCGWYDTYQAWYNFCAAGAASNVIHWWFDRNADYIARYRETHPDLPEFKYTGKGRSQVFTFFTEKWHENVGNYPHNVFNWFIWGSENGVQDSAIGQGGIFKEVFNDNPVLTEILQSPNRRSFNTFIEEALKEGKIVSFDENGALFGPHALTAWGFDFDEDGYINMVYYTNSATSWNNSDSTRDLSLCKIPVKYDANDGYAPYMESSIEINGVVEHGKIPIIRLYSYSKGTEYWEAYFADR